MQATYDMKATMTHRACQFTIVSSEVLKPEVVEIITQRVRDAMTHSPTLLAGYASGFRYDDCRVYVVPKTAASFLSPEK